MIYFGLLLYIYLYIEREREFNLKNIKNKHEFFGLLYFYFSVGVLKMYFSLV